MSMASGGINLWSAAGGAIAFAVHASQRPSSCLTELLLDPIARTGDNETNRRGEAAHSVRDVRFVRCGASRLPRARKHADLQGDLNPPGAI
jgi:hypothetical protein